MAGRIFREVMDYGLSDEKHFKCKVVTKDTGDGHGDALAIKHPALAIWYPSDNWDAKKEVIVYLLHLVKVNQQNLTPKELEDGIERFEIECRRTIRGDLKDNDWEIGVCSVKL